MTVIQIEMVLVYQHYCHSSNLIRNRKFSLIKNQRFDKIVDNTLTY